jgi:hypothetical protein
MCAGWVHAKGIPGCRYEFTKSTMERHAKEREGNMNRQMVLGRTFAITPFNEDGSLNWAGRVLIGEGELGEFGEFVRYEDAAYVRANVPEDTASSDRTFENETRLH